MARIWLAGLGLLVWQLGSMGFGFNEFMFGHPAPVSAVLASGFTALAWVVLAAWGGLQRRDGFGLVVAVLWLAIVGVLLLSLWTRGLEGVYGVMPWNGLVLLLLIAAGGPLYGLGSLVPVSDALVGTTLFAAGVLASVVAAHLAARQIGVRRPASRQAPSPPTALPR